MKFMSEGRARKAFSRINYTRQRDPEAVAHHESLKGRFYCRKPLFWEALKD